MEVYTPNTGQSKNLLTGEERAYNPNQSRDSYGRWSSGGSGGGGSAKSVDKSEKDAIIEHKEEIVADFESTGFKGTINIPPREIDVNSLGYDKRHILDEGHASNLKSARQYIKDAKLSVTKSIDGDEFENYYSDKGATYVNITKNCIRTSFPKKEFNLGTKRILETVDNHLKKKE